MINDNNKIMNILKEDEKYKEMTKNLIKKIGY